MRLMALFTVARALVCGVCLVALGALRNFTMYVVAERAGKLTVLARS